MTKLVVKRLVYGLGCRYLDHIRCEADVSEATARWRNMASKDYRCELGALFTVDGKRFCKRHTGDYLIKMLHKGDELVQPRKPKQSA